jgi:hypothetical protein
MQRLLWLATLCVLVTAGPVWSQDRDPRRLVTPSGEIKIPSEKTLERDAVTIPRNDFSTNDATAIKQMEEQNKRIDREVMKGICTGC